MFQINDDLDIYNKVNRCLARYSPRAKANNAKPCNTIQYCMILVFSVFLRVLWPERLRVPRLLVWKIIRTKYVKVVVKVKYVKVVVK